MQWYIDTERSSFIKEVYYEDDTQELTVHFKYGQCLIFCGVPLHIFTPFGEVESVGKYYLAFIKPKYTIMTDRPKTRNQCSDDKKRYIKMSLDVTKVNNKWFIEGEKGTYLNITLSMLPNGELDRYGNLGMVTQDVPKVIRDKEKDLPKDKKSVGAILGNGAEFEPIVPEGTPGSDTGKLVSEEAMDDLPF